MSSSVASPAHWRRIRDLLVWTRPQLYTHQGAEAALSVYTSSYPFPRASGLVHGWGAFQLPRLRSSTSAPPIWVAMCPFPRAPFPRLPFSRDCWWSFLGKLPAENGSLGWRTSCSAGHPRKTPIMNPCFGIPPPWMNKGMVVFFQSFSGLPEVL